MFSLTLRLCTLLLFIPFSAQAAVPSPDWLTLESEHYKIHYLPVYSQQAKRSLIIAERLYPEMQKRFNWQPEEKISVVVTDQYDSANGSASPIPFNVVNLRLSPADSINGIEAYDDWLTVLIEHELVHIFHMDKARGKVKRLRETFGRFIFLFPNILQPKWFIEGLATYIETHEGIGRGQSSYYQMIMREQVRQGVKSADKVNLPTDEQPLSQQYLYGVFFYQFLEQRYGVDSINRLVANYSDNLLPFAINSNAKQTLGKDITALWEEFKDFLKKKFEAEITQLEKSIDELGEIKNNRYLQNTQLDISDDNRLFYIDDDGNSRAYLVTQKESVKQPLIAVNPNSEFAFASGDTLYLSQIEFCGDYEIFYDLYRFNIQTKSLEQLTDCQRYKRFAVNQNNHQIAAVAAINSIANLDLLNADGQLIEHLWQGEYGDVIGQLDWSESRNKLLVSLKKLNQNWAIYEFDLETKQWQSLIEDNAINAQPKYSLKNSAFTYSSDKSGVYNIYKYDFESKQSVALTNVSSGAFSSIEGADGQLHYLHYRALGYQLYSRPSVAQNITHLASPKQPVARHHADVIDNLPTHEISAYNPWPDLMPRYWLPVFTFQDKGSEIGFATSGRDSLQHHFYELTATIGIDQQDLLGSFIYGYENWFSFAMLKENALYSGLVSNGTDLIRTSSQMQLSFALPFIKINKFWQLRLGLISFNDTSSYSAAGVPDYLDNNDDLLGLSFYYNSKRSYLKSHSPEEGRDVLLSIESSDTFKSDYAGNLATIEWREFFNLGSHHVLGLRYIRGEADNTMRPYRLGGLKTAWDDVSILDPTYSRKVFNKRNFALRGYADNSQQGNNLEMLSVEYRFPIQSIYRGWMAPPVGILNHSGRVFIESGSSWYDSNEKNLLTSTGFEWVTDTNLFYSYNMQFRIGVAHGLDEPGDTFTYFKLGSAF